MTANTRADGEEFLALAARFGIRPTTVRLPDGGRPAGAGGPGARPVQRRGGAAQLASGGLRAGYVIDDVNDAVDIPGQVYCFCHLTALRPGLAVERHDPAVHVDLDRLLLAQRSS